MVGKIVVNGFPEFLSYDLGADLDDVRDYLPNISFNEPGIHILKLQPGIGKSYAIKEFLKRQKSFLILTSRHKLIFEEYEGFGARHWMNFSEKCEIYGETEKLDSYGVSKRMICGHKRCNKRKCSYWKQFQTQKAVAPLTFLPTDRVLYKRGKKQGDFKFGLLVVDESMKEFRELQFDHDEVMEAVNVIEDHYPVKELINDFISYLDGDDIPSDQDARRITELRNMALWDAINNTNWVDVEKIAKLNIFEIRKYIYYHNIHKDITSSYPEPFLHNIINLALQGVPVVFLDATFDEEAFKVLLGRYIHENSIIKRESLINKKLGSINDLKIKIYRSNLKKREITIHRMDKDNYYYKIGFFNYQEETRMTENGMQTIDEIRSYINKAKRKFATIGIITYKGLKPHFRDLGPTEHYFNLKGSNELANVEALFIIGTPHAKPKDIVKEYNNICLTQISPKQVHRKIYKKLKNGYFIVKEENWESFNEKPLLKVSKEKKPRRLTLEGYTWWNHKILFNKQSRAGLIDADIFYPLRDFDYNNSESEKYQAIHRARLFRRGNVPEIYIFGDVPDQVKEEFNVKILDKKRSKEFFMGRLLKYKQFGGMYPLPLSQLITAIKISNSSLKPIDIGKKLKLYKDPDKKSGYNTSFINKIINGTVSLNKMSIIHEDIKKGIIDTKLIKKHSKVDEEFIDDCLMYAYDGDFIQPES